MFFNHFGYNCWRITCRLIIQREREDSLSQEKVLGYIKVDCFQRSEKGFGTFSFLFSYLSASPTWLSSSLLASWDRPHSSRVTHTLSLCFRTVTLEFEDADAGKRIDGRLSLGYMRGPGKRSLLLGLVIPLAIPGRNITVQQNEVHSQFSLGNAKLKPRQSRLWELSEPWLGLQSLLKGKHSRTGVLKRDRMVLAQNEFAHSVSFTVQTAQELAF